MWANFDTVLLSAVDGQILLPPVCVRHVENVRRCLPTLLYSVLHTDVSVRACTSCPPLLITNRRSVVAELLNTVAKHRYV